MGRAFHGGEGVQPVLLDGLAVVLSRGEDMQAGEEEDGGQAQQQEVEAGAVLLHQAPDAVDQRHKARQHDGHGHPAVGVVAAVLDALGLGGGGEFGRELRLFLQDGLGLLQLLAGLLGLGRQLLYIAPGFLRGLFRETAFAVPAEARDLRVDGGEVRQQQVHVLLPLEGALLLLPVVILHHEVGDGAEGALSGEAALAHGHPLEDPAHGVDGHIAAAIEPEAVEV